MIPFNKPSYTGNEDKYVLESIHSEKISGDGFFSRQCERWFQENLPCKKALLTPSCTHALELAALLLELIPGDEVILPSYTFVSTANAFVLRGAIPVFVDIDPSTMNINPESIALAITKKTRAIVIVHYAGVPCEMNEIMEIAREHGLRVIEDAAQAMLSTYKGKAIGTFGDLATFSFHETKNFTSAGEGGLLIINDSSFIERAEIIREKGTNRSRFFRGMVDKYTWVDLGSSYLPGDVQAAYLWGQLEWSEKISSARIHCWNRYYSLLKDLDKKGIADLPQLTNDSKHNGHCFYIKLRQPDLRPKIISYLKGAGILSVFHYVPLHSSEAGEKFGRFHGEDRFTTKESERILRLPLFYSLKDQQIDYVCDKVSEFFSAQN